MKRPISELTVDYLLLCTDVFEKLCEMVKQFPGYHCTFKNTTFFYKDTAIQDVFLINDCLNYRKVFSHEDDILNVYPQELTENMLMLYAINAEFKTKLYIDIQGDVNE
jgi:hypothetical protein